MTTVLIQISRDVLYSGEFGNAKRTIHTDKNKSGDIRAALDFLYRFFLGVVLRD